MRIVVLGGGESGRGAALLARKLGHTLWLSDRGPLSEAAKAELKKNGIPFEANGHSREKVLQADLVVKSPGIPEDAPLIKELGSKGIPVISEIEWAARHCAARLVGITGTNGKTTTTLLTYHLLQTAGFSVTLAGNVGNSFARRVVEESFDWAVLELSSFQLDGVDRFRPHLAALLNISPDHLDRYDYRMENYVRAKFRITRRQDESDWLLYLQGDEWLERLLPEREGNARLLPVTAGQITGRGLRLQNGETYDLSRSALRGRHNALNALFALEMARLAGAERKALQRGLETFSNAPHRLERVAEVGGVEYLNDSKATNVDAVYYALEAMEKPVIWIAGGTDKGNEYGSLQALVRQKVRALIALGKDNRKLKAAFEKTVTEYREAASAAEAVQMGAELARKGEVVLLSPACASFDRFKNYEDRGDQFREAVLALQKK